MVIDLSLFDELKVTRLQKESKKIQNDVLSALFINTYGGNQTADDQAIESAAALIAGCYDRCHPNMDSSQQRVYFLCRSFGGSIQIIFLFF